MTATPSGAISVPAALWAVPTSPSVALPVITRPQELPFSQLTWENFEKLCLRISANDGECQYCQLYGVRGQYQGGIDYYVRRRASEKYAVTQCKRYESFEASDLTAAVDRFIDGAWATKSDVLQIAVSAPIEERKLAEEIEKQATRLRTSGVSLKMWGISQLSSELKGHPDLVEDFFSEEWCHEFCGGPSKRRRAISAKDTPILRRELRQFYRSHFEGLDPGLPILAAPFVRGAKTMPFERRFVVPDVLELQKVETWAPIAPSIAKATNLGDQASATGERQGRALTEAVKVRRALTGWLTEADRLVIIGDPGSGKTTLLRYLMLELLSETPSDVDLTRKWGDRIPLWVPFALWTRLVATQPAAGLRDCLESWLRTMSAPESLTALVLQSLEDERLLLLVDGLDEWSNETAARTAVTALDTFVTSRQLPAVVTSRPKGYTRLGGLGADWKQSELAGLSLEQQSSLAERWFTLQDEISRTAGEVETIGDPHSRAIRLVEDVQRVPGLERLAATPLLMCGLIALRWQNLRLPSNRFVAYKELCQLFLELHPQRRLQSALASSNPLPLTEANRVRVLAALAYAIHSSPGSVSLERDAAVVIVRSFLEQQLCKTPGEALEQAEVLLAVGADTLGLLVEKAPGEVGFLHRVFQEHLAARHLRRLAFSEQCRLVKALADQAPWHDVLLNLCHQTEREDEVNALLDIVASASFPLSRIHERGEFLAEVAFNDLHCSPGRAVRIAHESFEAIECGTWMPTRLKLLNCVLDGLHSDTLATLVRSKLSTWFPSSDSMPSGLASALAKWPPDQTTAEVLFRLLNSEDAGVARSAGISLAERFGGNEAVGERLKMALQIPADAGTIAAMLGSLWRGWPRLAGVDQLIADAAKSHSELVRLSGLCGLVELGSNSTALREDVLAYCWDRGMAEWDWRPDILDALLKGWPSDTRIKKAALEALKQQFRQQSLMEWEYATGLLMRGYSKDTEVIGAFVQLFENEDYPQHHFNNNWELLAASFAGDPQLGAAVDNWCDRHDKSTDSHERYFCARVSKSDRAKQGLIKRLWTSGWMNFWCVEGLLEVWGVDDPDVAAAFKAVLAEPKLATYFACSLPKMVADKQVCRKKLISHLGSNDVSEYSRALRGFCDLPIELRDASAAQIALTKLNEDLDGIFHDSARVELIQAFGHHPQVVELALREVRRRQGHIGFVARLFAADLRLRNAVLERGLPLPLPLRRLIVERLSVAAVEDNYSFGVLSEYDREANDELKTLASIGYHEALVYRKADKAQPTSHLEAGLRVCGPDYEVRRRAALAGLIAFDRMDIAAAMLGHDGKPETWSVTDSLHRNRALSRYFGRHWPRIEKAFGESIWERIRDSEEEFYEILVEEARDQGLLDKLVEKTKNPSKGHVVTASGLRLLARGRPRSTYLREKCLSLVMGGAGDWYGASAMVSAAEILAEQFGGDPSIGSILEESLKKNYGRSGVILALCLGWPECQALNNPEITVTPPGFRMLVPAQIHIICRNTPAEKFFEETKSILGGLTGEIWDFLPTTTTALKKRFSTDDELCRLAMQRLSTGAASSSGKMTLPRLLNTQPKLAGELRTWCAEEYSRQVSGKFIPEMALDIFSGSQRPVAHALIELLQSLPV